MNKNKYVFTQLVGFLDNFKFLRIVKKYDGDKYAKSYTCWNQLLTMIFGQLSNRESFRDLIVALKAHAGKVYHLGIGKSSGRNCVSTRVASRCTRFMTSRLKSLLPCILPRQRCMIQRLCLRFRMRTTPITSLTVATTISAISIPFASKSIVP